MINGYDDTYELGFSPIKRVFDVLFWPLTAMQSLLSCQYMLFQQQSIWIFSKLDIRVSVGEMRIHRWWDDRFEREEHKYSNGISKSSWTKRRNRNWIFHTFSWENFPLYNTYACLKLNNFEKWSEWMLWIFIPERSRDSSLFKGEKIFRGRSWTKL